MRSLTQMNILSLTQTTQTYTDFASRFALATSGMCTLGVADKLRAFLRCSLFCEFCEFCVPNKNTL